MARPQNSIQGLFAKNRIDIGTMQMTANTTALLVSGGLRLSGKSKTLTMNSTSLKFDGPIQLNSGITLNANTTGLLPGSVSALPGNVQFDGFAFIKNSTGNVALAINTSGTTWKYLNVTTKLPT